MESSGRGHEFTVIESRVRTEFPPLSFIDKLKVKCKLKEVTPIVIKAVFTNRWYVSDLKFIASVGEVRSESGKTYNTRCAVFSSPDNSWVTVKGRFNDVKKLIETRFENRNNIIGYGR